MENFYLLLLVALVVLAIADLVVGVSNDAVNFLNSAIGSKAISFNDYDSCQPRYLYWGGFF